MIDLKIILAIALALGTIIVPSTSGPAGPIPIPNFTFGPMNAH